MDVFLSLTLLKGEIRTTYSSVYSASLNSDILHLPVEVAFSLFNKEAYFTHPRLPLHPVCDRRPDQKEKLHNNYGHPLFRPSDFSALGFFKMSALLRTMLRNFSMLEFLPVPENPVLKSRPGVPFPGPKYPVF